MYASRRLFEVHNTHQSYMHEMHSRGLTSANCACTLPGLQSHSVHSTAEWVAGSASADHGHILRQGQLPHLEVLRPCNAQREV
jgi:hypothetical protein